MANGKRPLGRRAPARRLGRSEEHQAPTSAKCTSSGSTGRIVPSRDAAPTIRRTTPMIASRCGTTAGLDARRQHLAHEQARELGPLGAEGRERLEQRVQDLRRVAASGLGGLESVGNLAKARREHRRVQPALAAEVVADQRLVDAGPAATSSIEHAGVAVLGEQRGPAGHQGLAGGFGVAPLAARGAAAGSGRWGIRSNRLIKSTSWLKDRRAGPPVKGASALHAPGAGRPG